jgi:hypothetical protein
MAQSGPTGPDGPPAPIDDFIVPMLVLGMIIYAVHFYRSNKQQAAKAV